MPLQEKAVDNNMIRLILKRHTKERFHQVETIAYETLDADIPQLEERLNSGGRDEDAYDFTTLIGAEVLKND